jgi:hypothetical protein
MTAITVAKLGLLRELLSDRSDTAKECGGIRVTFFRKSSVRHIFIPGTDIYVFSCGGKFRVIRAIRGFPVIFFRKISLTFTEKGCILFRY